MHNRWPLVHVFVCSHYFMNSAVCLDYELSNGVEHSLENRGIFHIIGPIFEPNDGFSLNVVLT